MTYKANLRVETDLGVLQVPMVECDQCQSEAVEELAGGWLKLEGIGPSLRIGLRPPDGGWHWCSLQCLHAAIQTIMKSMS